MLTQKHSDRPEVREATLLGRVFSPVMSSPENNWAKFGWEPAEDEFEWARGDCNLLMRLTLREDWQSEKILRRTGEFSAQPSYASLKPGKETLNLAL
jgi:hypothetical protein